MKREEAHKNLSKKEFGEWWAMCSCGWNVVCSDQRGTMAYFKDHYWSFPEVV